jgi:hypothetical protein
MQSKKDMDVVSTAIDEYPVIEMWQGKVFFLDKGSWLHIYLQTE